MGPTADSGDCSATPTPSLLQETRCRLADLHRDGHLDARHKEVLEGLIEEAEAHFGIPPTPREESSRGQPGGTAADVPTSQSRWAHLPAPLAEALFSGLARSDTSPDNEGNLDNDTDKAVWLFSCGVNLSASNLVCRGWKRAVTKHCRALSVKLDLEHTVPVWAKNLGQTFAGVKRLKLDGRKQYPSAVHSTRLSLGLASILSRCDLDELTIVHLFSDADLEAIPIHASGLRHLSLASPLGGDDPALDAAYPSRDSALRVLGKMTSLRSLEIGFLGRVQLCASWNALGTLAQLTDLTFLRSYVGLRDAVPSLCSSLTGLRRLSLPIPLTEQMAASMLRLTQLRHLHVQDPADLFGVMPALSPLLALTSISLSGSRATEASHDGGESASQSVFPPGQGWNGRQLPQVLTLEIADTAYPRYFPPTDGFANLAKLFPGLTTLTLKRTQVQGEYLHQLADLLRLRELTLSHVDISGGVQAAGLKAMAALRRLRIDNGHKGTVAQMMPLLPHGLEDLHVHCGYGLAVTGLTAESTAEVLMGMRHLRSAALHGIVDGATAPSSGHSTPQARVGELSAICRAKTALPALKHLEVDGIQILDLSPSQEDFQGSGGLLQTDGQKTSAE